MLGPAAPTATGRLVPPIPATARASSLEFLSSKGGDEGDGGGSSSRVFVIGVLLEHLRAFSDPNACGGSLSLAVRGVGFSGAKAVTQLRVSYQ